MKWGKPISVGISMNVFNLIALPLGRILYRFKAMPKMGRFEEK
jgi:hypothetical protein